jgi:hypothetical protein
MRKAEYPNAEEIRAILGPEPWTVCRNTKANRDRYGRCLTRKQWAEVKAKVLARRLAHGRA